MTEVLAVVNQKGGVGKTTSCINICASLSKTKRKTLLVDLDPQSNATRGCGVDPHALNHSINDALLGRNETEQCLVPLNDLGFTISSVEGSSPKVSIFTNNRIIIIDTGIDKMNTQKNLT